METFDKIIIGGGLYGLYSTLLCAEHGQKVLMLECERESFARATYINQARVHNGYHYPRSYSTAVKSAHYFDRFVRDYPECIHCQFDQIYATSADFSWTNAEQFKKFCEDSEIKCEEVNPAKYFKRGTCDGAFLTQEYTYDAKILLGILQAKLANYGNAKLLYNAKIEEISRDGNAFVVRGNVCGNALAAGTSFVLNATYASVNQICQMLNFEPFKIKYELCEIILCRVNEPLKNIGFTVMDGPFFSIMPFGKTGLHSLTSVTFTPHKTSFDFVPTFPCQKRAGDFCSRERLGNCNLCPQKPESAWEYMAALARKYLREEFCFEYDHSLFSMKPILRASEIDDSRPTVIRQHAKNPTFVSVLSGKINTVYDLNEVLLNE